MEAYELIQRPVPPTISDYLTRLSWKDWPVLDWEGRDLTELSEQLHARLPQLKGEGAEHFHDDVLELCRWGLEENSALGLRLTLARVETDSCRYFHTDKLHQRILCTYAGPGTEVVPEHNALRSGLGRQNNAQVVLDFSRVRRLRAGDAVLLRGDLHPGTLGKGAIHRSPEIQHQGLRRLVLRIDFIPT